jgi:hypothetical protein
VSRNEVFELKKQGKMKKTYYSPKMNVVTIGAPQLLAGSLLGHKGYYFEQKDFDGITEDTGNNLSRDFDWDEDEDY